MSNNYQQYGGNPYGSQQQSYGGGQQQSYGGQQQPYGGQQQPYGGGQQQYSSPYSEAPQDMAPTHQGYDNSQAYGSAAPQPSILSNPDFLTRVESVRKEIDGLSENISQIASLHQRAISSPDNSGSAQLEHIIAQTQILNTRIKDQVKYLETDAARSGGNVTKDSQVRNLKNQFKARLEQYQQEEVQYKKRYQEQIERQYRIVNPNADDGEVAEAVNADWGNEGVFQTALKSNRTGAATSVLGAVRARHNDIQKIEKTLLELNQLFQDLAEQVAIQEPMVQSAEQQTENVVKDTEGANAHLGKGISSARRARKLKWILCIIICIVILAVALGLGIYFGVVLPHNKIVKQK